MEFANKIDVKKKLTTFYEITSETGEVISDLRTAFMYNKSQPLQSFKSKIKEYEKEAGNLSIIIKEVASDNESMKPYVTVPDHLLKIWKAMDKLHDLIDKKIRSNILFSDKAVNETIYLLQRLIEILKPSADIILARNKFLSTYIQESQISLERNATAYATLHENRLITGECVPNASSIYVPMLEAIKNIAWHTKEIAVALGK
jgi:Na+/phosphate symporter